MTSNFTQVTDTLWTNSSAVFTYHSGVWASDGKAILIDPGLSVSEIQALADAVREHGWIVQAVVLTHGHWDHILGAEAFPGVPVIAQAEYLTSPRLKTEAIRKMLAQSTELGRTEPFAPPQPTETFTDKMTLPVGSLNLELFHTPGHSNNHLMLYEPSSQTLWTADMLTDEEIPYVIENLGQFQQSIERAAGYNIQVMVPCHGTVARDPAEIQARINGDRTYLAEIHTRVQAAVNAGKTIEQTKELCQDIPYRQPFDDNRGAHRRNVESAYVEFGGQIDPDSVGWRQTWLEMTT